VGGSGSGRRGWHDKKTTVEECLTLSASALAREGVIARSPDAGFLSWTNTTTGERTSSLAYVREIDGNWVTLHLRYTVTRRAGETHDIDLPIVLLTTPSAVGGSRWWFACPLIVNGLPCGRRVGKLYLPPGTRYFGCRHCYDLTCTSCQESHRYDRLIGQLASETGVDPRLVKAMFVRR
jgi:hypothetical protein